MKKTELDIAIDYLNDQIYQREEMATMLGIDVRKILNDRNILASARDILVDDRRILREIQERDKKVQSVQERSPKVTDRYYFK